MTKSELRQLSKEKNKTISKSEKEAIDKKISENFLSLDMESGKVFVYVSFGDEIETRGIIDSFIKEKCEVFVPLCREKGEMEAKRIVSLSELTPGKYGIPEPPESAETIDPSELSLIVVPGLAFGRDFSRLGRGAGYYDRFLEKAEKATKVALCREMNLYETVPCEEHDRKVDIIVTEERIIKERKK